MDAGMIEAMADTPRARAAAAQRAELMAASDANARAVFSPQDAGGLPQAVRLAFASRIAALNGDERLAAEYRAMAGSAPAGLAGDPRSAAMQRHVDLVTRTPRAATRADVEALLAAGVAEADIVRLSQLIAFVNYQLRVVAGLRLIGGDA